MDESQLAWNERVVSALEGQVGVNEAAARALEALSLQADRYDAALRGLHEEIAELRDEVLTLTRRLDAAQTATGWPVNYCRSCGRVMGTSVLHGRQYPVCRNPECKHADVLVTMHSVLVPEESERS